MRRFLLAVLSLLLAVGVAMAIFDVAGLIDAKKILVQAIIHAPGIGPYLNTYRLGQKASAAFKAREAEIAAQMAELEAARAQLAAERQKLEEEKAALEAERASLERSRQLLAQQQQELNRTADAAATRARQAKLYAEMPAKDAAKILQTMSDPEVAAILVLLPDKRIAELMPYFEPERAGRILQLMSRL